MVNGPVASMVVLSSRSMSLITSQACFSENGTEGGGSTGPSRPVSPWTIGAVCSFLQILPTLPETYTGDGWASGIVMSPDDSVVVVSNRKHDSLTSFLVDKETGLLRYSD